MTENTEVPQQRITVYLPKEEHKKLKAKLALLGISVSAWFRRLVKKELEQ